MMRRMLPSVMGSFLLAEDTTYSEPSPLRPAEMARMFADAKRAMTPTRPHHTTQD